HTRTHTQRVYFPTRRSSDLVVLDQRTGRDADAEPARRGFEHEIGVLEALALLDVDARAVDVPRPIGPGLQARLGVQQLVVTQIGDRKSTRLNSSQQISSYVV